MKYITTILILFVCSSVYGQTGVVTVLDTSQTEVVFKKDWNFFPANGGESFLSLEDTATGTVLYTDTASHLQGGGSDTTFVDSLIPGTVYLIKLHLKRTGGSWKVMQQDWWVKTLPNPEVEINSFSVNQMFDSLSLYISYSTHGLTVDSLLMVVDTDTVVVNHNLLGSGNFVYTYPVTAGQTYTFSFPEIDSTVSWVYTVPLPGPPLVSMIDGFTNCDSSYIGYVVVEDSGAAVSVDFSVTFPGGTHVFPTVTGLHTGDTVLFALSPVADTTTGAATLLAQNIAGFYPVVGQTTIYPRPNTEMSIDSVQAINQQIGFVQVRIKHFCGGVVTGLITDSVVTTVTDTVELPEVADTVVEMYFSGLSPNETYYGFIGVDTLSDTFLLVTPPWNGPSVHISDTIAGLTTLSFTGVVDANAPLSVTVLLHRLPGWVAVDSTVIQPPTGSFTVNEGGLAQHTVYNYAVVAYSSAGSDTVFVSGKTLQYIPPVPSVRTDPVISRTDTSLIVEGLLISHATQTDTIEWYFGYKVGSWFTNSLRTVVLQPGGMILVRDTLFGLPPNSVIPYYLSGSNLGGIVYGDTLSGVTDTAAGCIKPTIKQYPVATKTGSTLTIPFEFRNYNGSVATVLLWIDTVPQLAVSPQIVYVGSVSDTSMAVTVSGLVGCSTYWYKMAIDNGCQTVSTVQLGQMVYNATTDAPSKPILHSTGVVQHYTSGIDIQPTIEVFGKAEAYVVWGPGTNTTVPTGSAHLTSTTGPGIVSPWYPIFAGGPGDYWYFKYIIEYECGVQHVFGPFFFTNLLVGIERIDPKKIAVFPNPSSGLITVTGLPQGGRLEVYSVLGTMFLRKEKVVSREVLDLSDLERGIYFLAIYGEGTTPLIVKKIEKQ